ncbi:twin arginine translocation system, TatB protein [Campylobacter blaseri]|uniref:Sec-independent protein translocase protein TatB homolog n=1 Tax=Campylobacter blaseri TaxID=2042961 RepID=A0A2P8R223_9BACT|nr:Sec-independent protein translocase protein TatB [Campylobacter blaseri]PSM52541.1 twin-arginine translocase subunit TatB [Campylobacter blaseri]PSM54189.1 twin-arginine translocase subunit TatB [Campylobacter blaseri]QKF85840.1 twin arginine translocation system, TatB protein [Campylobacter blaseri]
MFGMGFSEIFMIAVVAILALGPDKLPKAMYEIAKYFKVLKKTINDAKTSFEQEVRIAELKEDAQKYKESINKTKESVRKKLTFEELEEIKSGLNSAKEVANKNLEEIKKDIDSVKNIDTKQSTKNKTKESNKNKEVRKS